MKKVFFNQIIKQLTFSQYHLNTHLHKKLTHYQKDCHLKLYTLPFYYYQLNKMLL